MLLYELVDLGHGSRLRRQERLEPVIDRLTPVRVAVVDGLRPPTMACSRHDLVSHRWSLRWSIAGNHAVVEAPRRRFGGRVCVRLTRTSTCGFRHIGAVSLRALPVKSVIVRDQFLESQSPARAEGTGLGFGQGDNVGRRGRDEVNGRILERATRGARVCEQNDAEDRDWLSPTVEEVFQRFGCVIQLLAGRAAATVDEPTRIVRARARRSLPDCSGSRADRSSRHRASSQVPQRPSAPRRFRPRESVPASSVPAAKAAVVERAGQEAVSFSIGVGPPTSEALGVVVRSTAAGERPARALRFRRLVHGVRCRI